MNFRSKAGFTLIELLVVIAIIGILSSIITVSLGNARAKGRDAKRAQEVRSLKTALELYYNDNNTYPQAGSYGAGNAMNILTGSLVPSYIPSIPNDPLAGYEWQYVWGPSNAYGLWIYREQTSARCGTGVNFNPGWWGIGSNLCPF